MTKEDLTVKDGVMESKYGDYVDFTEEDLKESIIKCNQFKVKEFKHIAKLSWMGLKIEVDSKMKHDEWKIVCSPHAKQIIEKECLVFNHNQ